MENVAFLKYHMDKHPIIVDPDNQASQWLKKTYENFYTQTKIVVDTNQGAKLIETPIQKGHKLVLLFENDLDEFAQSLH